MTISQGMNGVGKRQLESWIESFVKSTDGIESSPTYRRWAAISVIAAILEQKVYIRTASGAVTYPHLYTFLIGEAGNGKTWAISTATKIMRQIPDQMFSPTSINMATLVDNLEECKRTIIQLPDPAVDYNSMYIVADELGAFMHEYSHDLIAGLTTFYDVEPYSRSRVYRGKTQTINRPQLNILCGATPSMIKKFIPEDAWEQGFASRVIMIYADDKPMVDIWNSPKSTLPAPLLQDLQIISKIEGQLGWTEDWARAMHNWKLLGFTPAPTHPKLRGYCQRRERHIIKLSMVSAIDRGSDMMLNKEDFNRAILWLLTAEREMPKIFQGGSYSADAKAIAEILHFIKTSGKGRGVNQQRIMNFAMTHVHYAHNVRNIISLMEDSGQIIAISVEKKTGLKIYTINDDLLIQQQENSVDHTTDQISAPQSSQQ